MAFDRRKMFFYEGVVETKVQHEQRMDAYYRRLRNKSNPGMTLAMMMGLAASFNLSAPSPPPDPFK